MVTVFVDDVPPTSANLTCGGERNECRNRLAQVLAEGGHVLLFAGRQVREARAVGGRRVLDCVLLGCLVSWARPAEVSTSFWKRLSDICVARAMSSSWPHVAES